MAKLLLINITVHIYLLLQEMLSQTKRYSGGVVEIAPLWAAPQWQPHNNNNFGSTRHRIPDLDAAAICSNDFGDPPG